jgi:YHS domain-containing protein
MISALIREFLLPLLLFLFLRRLLGGIFASLRKPAARSSASPPRPPAHAGGVLRKDPVCGTYVTAESGIARTIQGEVVYFCSQECSDKYRAG